MPVQVHAREPCFMCEQREREFGQILCTVCLAWAQVRPNVCSIVRSPTDPHNTNMAIEHPNSEFRYLVRVDGAPQMAPISSSKACLEVARDIKRSHPTSTVAVEVTFES